jgi:hypothetical protein
LEDRGYTFSDVINQIKNDLGFTYDEKDQSFKISENTYLRIYADESGLVEAYLDLPSDTIDLIEEDGEIDAYLASLESVNQIMDYFSRLGGISNENN